MCGVGGRAPRELRNYGNLQGLPVAWGHPKPQSRTTWLGPPPPSPPTPHTPHPYTLAWPPSPLPHTPHLKPLHPSLAPLPPTHTPNPKPPGLTPLPPQTPNPYTLAWPPSPPLPHTPNHKPLPSGFPPLPPHRHTPHMHRGTRTRPAVGTCTTCWNPASDMFVAALLTPPEGYMPPAHTQQQVQQVQGKVGQGRAGQGHVRQATEMGRPTGHAGRQPR